MEPYRGFPEFIESIAYVQERRPNCHVVIVGSERVCYGRSLPHGESYKDHMLKKVPLDLSRVHFVGPLPYGLYLKVIQASDVHVYLTRPFVLSWSMIESLSTGCLVIGSDTGPVREVIRDGENGLLVDYFSPKQVADRIDEVLDHPTRMAEIRVKARQTVLERYSLAKNVAATFTTDRASRKSFDAAYSWYGTRTGISSIFCSEKLTIKLVRTQAPVTSPPVRLHRTGKATN